MKDIQKEEKANKKSLLLLSHKDTYKFYKDKNKTT